MCTTFVCMQRNGSVKIDTKVIHMQNSRLLQRQHSGSLRRKKYENLPRVSMYVHIYISGYANIFEIENPALSTQLLAKSAQIPPL